MLDLPLVVALVGSAAFVFCTDEDWRWKVLASGLLAVSLAIRFASPREPQVLVPLILEGVAATGLAVYGQVNR